MMSDHWKLLANILGTPGPAEPAAKEPTKKKFDVSSEENKSNVVNPVVRDPLAEIVIRQPEPVVPGFDVPAPPPVAEKPAKRSAWDTLIGTLGIKTASDPEPDVEVATPAATGYSVTPSRSEAAPSGRRFGGELDEPTQRGETRPTKRGFGAGLVDAPDAEIQASVPIQDLGAAPEPLPPRAASFRESEPRESRGPREPRETREPREQRPRRDSGADDVRSAELRSTSARSPESRSPESRSPESRSAEPRSSESVERDPRPNNPRRRDEPREGVAPSRDSRGRDRDREPRSRDSRPNESRSSTPQRNEAKSDLPPKPRSFGDGLSDNDGILDWDVDQDDVFLRDDDLIDDDVEGEPSEPMADSDRSSASPQGRNDEDRPRSRGRRGGSRNRGRGDIRSEEKVPAASGDEIGWNDEVADDDVSPVRTQVPSQADASRDAGPRRDDGRDSSRGGRGREPRRDSAPRDSTPRDSAPRDSSPRGEGRREPLRDEPRREAAPPREGQRREPVREDARRDEARRDAPAREVARRPDRTEDAPAADGARRSGRRGQRQQMSGESASTGPNPRVNREEVPRLPDADLDYDDLMSEELPSPTADAASSDSADGLTRPRRRRGRRGRGGSSNASPTSDRGSIDRTEPADEVGFEDVGFEDVGFAAELSPDAIDAVELNDDLDDDVEAERVRRGRRRGRGRGEPRERSDSPVGADSTTSERSTSERSTTDESAAGSKNRGVPTWLDTVSLLVEPNIERHRRSGPPRQSQERGGRR